MVSSRMPGPEPRLHTHGGHGREPEDAIGEVLMAVSQEQVSEPAVQLVERMGFGRAVVQSTPSSANIRASTTGTFSSR